MPTRDVVSWNAMISVYAQSGHWKEALQLYDIMQLNGFLVNKVTYVIVLGACVKSAVLTEGRKIHDSILNHGLDSDVTIGNALLYMYSMCVRPDDAQIVFDKMIERDVISWTVMIAVYAQLGQVEISIHLFKQMQQKGVVPNKVTCIIILAACATQVTLIEGQSLHAHILACKYDLELMVGNALINMYGKCGSWMDARLVFDKMSEQDVISCNAMIAVCAQHGRAKDALQVFTQMLLQAIKPNEVTFLCILTACSHAGLVEEGCDCFHFMKQDHEIALAVEHYICMVDLLGRAGRLEEAEYLMTDMPFQPSFGPFMALLGACRYQADRKRGYRIAKHLSELDLQNAAPYVMLANVYAAADKEDDAESVLDSMMSLNDQNFSELALLDSMKVSCSDVLSLT